jgi:putative glycosyltransferase (TIGR04372 family)
MNLGRAGDSDNGAALLDSGRALLAEGRLPEAQAMLLQAVAADPTDAERYPDLADVSEALGQPALALACYRRALALRPDDARLCYRLGLLLSTRDDSGAAERRLRRALALAQPFAEALVALGVVFQKAGRQREAISVFRDAIMRAPDYTPGFIAMGVALREAGAPSAQVAAVERVAAEREPGRAAIVLPVVQIYRDLGDEATASRFATALIDRQMAAAESDEIGRHGLRILEPDDLLTRIGECAFQLDLHVKMKRLGWLPPFVSLLLAPRKRVVNAAFLDCWRPHLSVIDDPVLIERLQPLRSRIGFNPVYVKLPDGRAVSKNRAFFAVQQEWQRQGRGPVLDLSSREVEAGGAALRRMGVPDGAWFVCVHVRESGFLKEEAASTEATRNADIRDYLPGIEEITRRGGWVVRLGDASMRPLPALPQVVDYARSPHKSEAMDVFLAARCRFFFGTTSGMCVVSSVFGVPVGAANFFPAGERLVTAGDVVVPKLYRDRASGRILSFDECLAMPLALTYDAMRLQELGIEALDTDAEDLRDLAVEMLERADGQRPCTQEDEALQRRWDALCRPFSTGEVGCRIGRGFLRRHRHLFRNG